MEIKLLMVQEGKKGMENTIEQSKPENSKREEVLKLLQPVNATGDTAEAGSITIEGETEHAGEAPREAPGGKADGESMKAIVEADQEVKHGQPASQFTLRNIKKKQKQKAYLSAWLAAGGDCGKAAAVAGMNRDLHYYWLRTDQAYQAQHETALLKLKAGLEAEAWRRANGYKRDIVYKGEVTGQYNEYSDNLLMFALKKLDPSYRDNANNINIGAHGDIEISFSEPNKS